MPHDRTAERDSARSAIHRDALTLLVRALAEPARLDAAKEVWDGALCAQVDPELFFPDLGEPSAPARNICAACPVRVPCLEVFGAVVAHGVVGGLTVQQRRDRRAAARKEAAA